MIFDIAAHCEIITTIMLINTSTFASHSYLCLCGETLKIYSFSKFQIYNVILLTTITMLYITSQ